jgi:hypothetical protein
MRSDGRDPRGEAHAVVVRRGVITSTIVKKKPLGDESFVPIVMVAALCRGNACHNSLVIHHKLTSVAGKPVNAQRFEVE